MQRCTQRSPAWGGVLNLKQMFVCVGFGFFVVVNVGVVKLTFVILLKIRVGSVFLSRQNNHLFLLFCFGKKVSSENTGFGKPALFSDTAE